MGGLATMARTHLQTRHLQTFGDQGKGCVFIGLRFQGWELAIGNVYLESGTGPGSILASSPTLRFSCRSCDCPGLLLETGIAPQRNLPLLGFLA